ncbi:thiamine pyrophosphate-dependent enzyme [Streptomyces sp. NPDC048606]|uniref:thiamine pyrophosphate-dependent enzyme n=1 Tax=Streptomyces sp. NPDC048606 TaxID=3154726 RepID=UPI003424637B
MSMSGDGGFSVPMGDFLPLVQYGPPVKVVVFNDSSPVAAERDLSIFGLPSRAATRRNPDRAAGGPATGAHGVRVGSPGSSQGP